MNFVFVFFVPAMIMLALLATALKLPWVKGRLGEMLVQFIVWLRLDRKTYHPLHNVTLLTPDGTTQIDHIFVSRYGIFVLETKNMQGWIFGGKDHAQWTQKIYKNSFRFQNPLRQNFKHIKAIEAALDIPLATIHSVVTFVGDSTFKTAMPPNVTQGGGFIAYIKSFREQTFTEDQVAEFLTKFQSKSLARTFATDRAHVKQLKTRADPNAERKCPKCGNPLVIRTVKAGTRAGQQFWGCSTFPKCKITQDIG